MPFNIAQTNAFFQDADQMSIANRTAAQLVTEGIDTVDALGEFEDEDFKQIMSNLQHPPQIPDPANAALLINDVPYVIGAKSLRRLKVAAHAVRYYQNIDRPTTPNNMHYTNTLKHFEIQWKALVARTDETDPDTPKITRNLKVTRWSEAFADFLHRVNGIRHIPLAYVIRSEVDVPAAAPALIRNRPYSAEHESIEGELIARASHGHALFRNDNAKVYHFLEEATRGTQYSSSLKTFQRSKNGREAYLAIISQHAGADKWERELKAQESFLTSRIWKGNTNFSLERFIEQHRSAFISMEQCSQHVAFQLPNEHTRVRYLIDNIQCNDAELQASLAAIRMDTTGPDAKRNNFENAAQFLLPSDPVAKKRKLNSNNPNNTAQISLVDGNTDGQLKQSIGKTGVHFCYYKGEEYKALSNEQKLELKEWRTKKESNKRKTDKPGDDGRDKKKKFQRDVASVVKKLEESKIKEKDAKAAELKEITDVILAATSASAPTSAPASAPTSDQQTAVVMATRIQGIMSRGSKKATSD